MKGKLPSSTVWSILEDDLGYIWIGTKSGLCRFDGNQLEIFTTAEGLRSNNIVYLSRTDDGNIIALSYYKGLNLITINHQPQIEPLGPPISLNSRTFLQNGILSDIVYLRKFRKNTFSTPLKFQDSFIRANEMIPFGNDILIAYENGLWIFDFDRQNFRQVFQFDTTETISSLHIGNDGRLFAGSQNRLYVLKEFEIVESYNTPEHVAISDIAEDRAGNIYIKQYNNAFVKKYTSNNFVPLLFNEPVHVNYFMVDSWSNLWISTWGQGVLVLPNSPFRHFKPVERVKHNSIQNIQLLASGSLIVSTLYDICILEDGLCSGFNIPPGWDGLVNIGELYAWGNNLFAPHSHLLKNQPDFRSKNFPGELIFLLNEEMTQAREGSGLFLLPLPEENGIEMVIKEFRADKGFIDINEVFADIPHTATIRQPRHLTSKHLWIADKSSLHSYDLRSDQWFHSAKDSSNFFAGHLNDHNIYKISSTTADSLWFCTDKGLFSFLNGNWAKIWPQDGSEFYVRDIAFDGASHVWLASAKGLHYIGSDSLYTFSVDNGLMSSELEFVEYDENSKTIYTGNVSGLSYAHKDSLLQIAKAATSGVYIKNVSIGKQNAEPDTVYQIDPHQNKIDIEIAFCDFSSFNETQFQYRLNNQKWEPLNGPNLSLTQLRAGDYSLGFRAGRNSRSWGYSPVLKLEVLPFWYQTTWFYGFLVLVVILTTVAFTQFLVRRLRHQAARKIAFNARLNELEQRALTTSMNPHFIFNTMNIIQSFVQKGEKKEASETIAEFADLIREYLNASKKKMVSLDDEIHRIKKYLALEHKRFSNQFDYQIEIDEQLETELISIPTMIIQPYVENAIWHGIRPKGKGKLQLNFFEKEEKLYIEIIDDGVGFDRQTYNSKDVAHLQMATKTTRE